MNEYSLTHVVDAVLLRDLAMMVARERAGVAEMLALISEVDARRLYAPAGFSSMHAYLVKELRLSDDAAYKGIQAARAARRFPILYLALADGRLHLTAVCLLAPHLTAENMWELVESSTHRRQPEIEAMLARRFLAPPVCERSIVRAIPPKAPTASSELAVRQVDWLTLEKPVDSKEDAPGLAPSSPSLQPSSRSPSPVASEPSE